MTRTELMLLEVVIRAGQMVINAAKKYLDVKTKELEQEKQITQS